MIKLAEGTKLVYRQTGGETYICEVREYPEMGPGKTVYVVQHYGAYYLDELYESFMVVEPATEPRIALGTTLVAKDHPKIAHITGVVTLDNGTHLYEIHGESAGRLRNRTEDEVMMDFHFVTHQHRIHDRTEHVTVLALALSDIVELAQAWTIFNPLLSRWRILKRAKQALEELSKSS